MLNKLTLYNDLVDALYATFGEHAGFRTTHAKGVIASGSFVAAPDAKSVSRAEHLQGQKVPVQIRFSNFSGVPTTADSDPDASPRGLALRFLLTDRRSTDIVAHTYDGFPVGTPEAFLQFLQGIAARVANPGDVEPLDRFLAAHPRAKQYLEAPKPTPPSYLSERYYGINALRFVNASGSAVHGRYRIEPMMPVVPDPALDRGKVLAMPADFLAEELATRLRGAPCRMRLILQLAASGDVVEDGSITWPREGLDARAEVELGILDIESLAALPEQQPRSHGPGFNPGDLIDGIEQSSDPMIEARREIYRLAVRRRQGDKA
jgi:catalase